MNDVDYRSPIMRLTRRGLLYLALIGMSAIILAPFYIVLVLALSRPAEVFAWPPVWWPAEPQ